MLLFRVGLEVREPWSQGYVTVTLADIRQYKRPTSPEGAQPASTSCLKTTTSKVVQSDFLTCQVLLAFLPKEDQRRGLITKTNRIMAPRVEFSDPLSQSLS